MDSTQNQNGETLKIQNQNGVENHKTAAIHLEAAAEYHLEAAKHHAEGNHDKAAQCTVKAQGHVALANDAHKQDVKYHALNH